MMSTWDSFGPFFKGFVLVFVGLVAAGIILWLFLGAFSDFLILTPVAGKHPVSESTEWINFVIAEVIPHFQGHEAAAKLGKGISAIIAPNKLVIRSVGNPPVVREVVTLDMKEADDIRMILPIECIDGPSVDFILSKSLSIEFDLHQFAGNLLLSWPGNSDRKMDVRFNGRVTIDFRLVIRLFSRIAISITDIPVFGTVVKKLVALTLSRKQFPIDLPQPRAIEPQ